NRFRYRLKGLETSWNEVDASRRRARYTNLEPGKYRFEVLASNNEGIWNEEGVGVDLIVMPPWWMTWWARIMVLAACACLIYGFIYWRLKINRLRERELESTVRAKTRQLEEANASVVRLNEGLEKRVNQ